MAQRVGVILQKYGRSRAITFTEQLTARIGKICNFILEGDDGAGDANGTPHVEEASPSNLEIFGYFSLIERTNEYVGVLFFLVSVSHYGTAY